MKNRNKGTAHDTRLDDDKTCHDIRIGEKRGYMQHDAKENNGGPASRHHTTAALTHDMTLHNMTGRGKE